VDGFCPVATAPGTDCYCSLSFSAEESMDKNLLKHKLSFAIAAVVLTCAVGATAQTQADKEYEVGAVLWQQSSGEERALAYQAYALARMMLDRDLKMNRRSRMKRAVIVDIDETILDNSAHETWLIRNHQSYNAKDWTEWCKQAKAGAVPGAVEFLRYANSRGVRVFYVTNRQPAEKEGTVTNLKQLGFPEVNDETLLIRTDGASSSKEPRRRAISAKYHVVLLMGDDLNDFSDFFENSTTVASRIAAVEQNKAQFGTHFIMLPNPMYGHWEDAIMGNTSKMSEGEKAEKRRAALKE
jgi:5'-nucleotidase (lipoprotein e(P4) family)